MKRFGRCAHFVIVDTDTWDFQAVPNPAAGASGGAEVRAAEHLVTLGVQAVIARDVGPNAARVFVSAGFSVYAAAGNTVREAVEAICRAAIGRRYPREAKTPMTTDKTEGVDKRD